MHAICMKGKVLWISSHLFCLICLCISQLQSDESIIASFLKLALLILCLSMEKSLQFAAFMQNLPNFALQHSKSKRYAHLQINLGTAVNWILKVTEGVNAVLWLRTDYLWYLPQSSVSWVSVLFSLITWCLDLVICSVEPIDLLEQF